MCGSKVWRFWRKKLRQVSKDKTEECEVCSDCENIRPSYPRDASGNKVEYSDALTGKYSYALDTHFTGQRALSEHLKRNDLVQTGAEHTGGKKW